MSTLGSATRGLWAAQQGTRKHQEVASESFSAGDMTDHPQSPRKPLRNYGTVATPRASIVQGTGCSIQHYPACNVMGGRIPLTGQQKQATNTQEEFILNLETAQRRST